MTDNDIMKYEIASELGLIDKVTELGWAGLTAKEAGKIGGMLTSRKKQKKKAEEAKKALDAYRETLVNDTMQYPMNISKIQSSQVYVVGDYVFFIMLGQIPDEMLEQGDESEMLKASQEQNQIAIDAINRVLGVEAK